MGLFGEEMRQVVTPDGRQITVPAQLAQAFPGLQPFTPPEVAQPPELPVAPPFVPQPSDALPTVTPDVPPQPSTPAPGPVTQPQQSYEGPANTVKPVTNAQLAKMGPAGAANVELGAQRAQSAAVERQGEALANQATAIGAEMERVNAHADKLLEERRVAAEQRAAELQSATDALTREAKSISEVRVDRSVDHPVLAALSSALIGLGQAMNGQPIDAMSAVYKAIDRKVAAQMADLDQRRANYAMSKDALGMQRQAGRDRLDEMDAHRLAYLDQAKRQLEEIKQKTSSDVIRSNTSVLQAELDAKMAQTISGAEQRFDQRQQQKAALAEQRAARQQSAAQFKQTFAENKRQFDVREANDLKQAELSAQAHGNAAKAKAAADAQKTLRENGIRDVAKGEYLLEPEGEKMVAEAKKLEEAAVQARAVFEKEQDPNKKQALAARINATEQRASELRGEALASHAVQGRNSDQSAKVQGVLADTQSGLTLIDQIKDLRAGSGPQWTVTTDADQQMRAKVTLLGLQIKEAYKLGALDKGTDAYMQRVAPDPTNITIGDFELAAQYLDAAKGTDASLDALADALESRARNELGGIMKNPERYKFQRSTRAKLTDEQRSAADVLRGRSSLEQAAEKGDRGALGKAADIATDAFGAVRSAVTGDEYKTPAERRSKAAEESGSARYPGLSEDQAPGATQLLNSYRVGGEKAAGAGDTLVSIATNSSRPELKNAMLTTLRDNAPDLYQRAIAKLGKDEQTEIVGRSEAVSGAQPVALLQKLSIDGDSAARAELARRAVSGDVEAAKAIQQVMKSRTSWRPTGAVK